MRRLWYLIFSITIVAALAPAAGAAPLARWSLDEGTGQVAFDRSGAGHNGRLGALSGPDAFDPVWTSGRLGTGLRFEGAQRQYVAVAASAALVPARVSVEAWVRRSGTPGEFRYVLASGARACQSAPYGMYSAANGGLAFYVSDDARFVASPRATPTSVWDGGWHHAVGTYDGQAVRLYLDGKQVGAGTTTGLMIASGLAGPGVSIGSYRGTCELPFTGDVDEVAVHSRALSAAEIAGATAKVASRPTPAQVPPVTGPPADPRALSRTCLRIKVAPRRILARQRTVVRLTVRRSKRRAAGVRVTVSGAKLRQRAKTGPAGKARLVIRAPRHGRLNVAAAGQPRRCGRGSIRVIRRR